MSELHCIEEKATLLHAATHFGNSQFQCRRLHMKALLTLLLPQWAACSEQNRQPVITNEDDALRHKFRGIYGGELRIDAMVPLVAAALYMSNGDVYHGTWGIYGPNGGSASGFGGYGDKDRLVVPKTLRMVIYDERSSREYHPKPFAAYTRRVMPDGTAVPEGMNMGTVVPALVLHDVTVPIAERFPDALLDRARQYKGSSIRLKLRMMPEALLLGWEIRPGLSYPFKKNEFGTEYVSDEDLMIGGDFCERRVVNVLVNNQWSLVEKKGWYIHPKTGQKIETDF